MISQKTSNDLFNKIRSKFGNITIGDSAGNATADPKQAVFFDFEFTEAEDKFGRISISLADGESMKVFYNRDLVNKIDETEKGDWFQFIKELKDFAVEHQLNFDVRDITKSNLTKQDYQNLADTNKTVNTDEMSEELSRITKLAGIEETKSPQEKIKIMNKIEKIKKQSKDLMGPGDADQIKKNKEELARLTKELHEGLTGTSKSSFENLDKTRLIIRHKGKVDENVPGARSRQISSLFIENEDGERFKYPIVHLAGARAMTRHVANGGRPHDDFGQHIIQTSEDIAKLNSFARFVSNKDQLNDSAGDIIEQTKMKLENLRNYVKNLSKQSHYEAAVKDFKTPEAVEMDDATANTYREKFTLKNLDNRVEDALPLIHRVMSEYKDEDDMPAPVNYGAAVQSFLANPDKKLVLRKDPTADKMLAVTKFTDKNTMLSSILSDIAARLLSRGDVEDNIANFASRVADEMEGEGQPFFKPSADYVKNKKIAIQLAKRYIDDYKKMQSDPAYADQVRMDPGAYKPKVDRQGKAKEETAFEGWADNIAEQKPYVSMYSGEDGKQVYDVLDKDGQSAYKSGDYDTAVAYLRKNFNTLAGKQPAMDDINENPEANQEMSMDYEFTGDDGETAYGTLHYKVVNGKVDPNSLRGESEYEGNAKVDDEFATAMVQPGGADHEQALDDAQDDYNYEAQRMQSKFGEGNEFAQAVQKAKAAGMKAGDKFKVGDKEYTLKDAIELAGLNLNEFFSEEEITESKTQINESKEDSAFSISGVDNEINRIVHLAKYQ
jgi:hypothetical protein